MYELIMGASSLMYAAVLKKAMSKPKINQSQMVNRGSGGGDWWSGAISGFQISEVAIVYCSKLGKGWWDSLRIFWGRLVIEKNRSEKNDSRQDPEGTRTRQMSRSCLLLAVRTGWLVLLRCKLRTFCRWQM